MGLEIPRREFLVAAASLVAGGDLAAGGIDALAAVPRRTAAVPRTLEQAMRGRLFERGARGYAAAAHVYNERFDYVLPRAVARPLDARDVSGAVRWAVGHDVPLRARSGGHSYAGYSTITGGVMLDLRNLRQITVNRRAGTATVGAGAQLI